MPNYRRARVGGGTYFFTVVTNQRRPILATDIGRRLLRTSIERCREKLPFTIDAFVLLPDHLHSIWSLPRGDDDYSTRWGVIKKAFTEEWLRQHGAEARVSVGRQKERRRGVWQPRFWEHTIEDEHDFDRHFDYIHYNAVKHRLVQRPRDWRWSTFHRWVREGVYSSDWACAQDGTQKLDFLDIQATVGEK